MPWFFDADGFQSKGKQHRKNGKNSGGRGSPFGSPSGMAPREDYGKGKGRSKGKDSWGPPPPATASWCCCWATCKAAQQHKATHHDNVCFLCFRPKSTAMNPPLTSMVQWAFDARLKAVKDGGGSGADKASAPSTKGKGSGKGKPSAPSAEGSAALQALRVAQLKAARAEPSPSPPPAAEVDGSMDTAEAPAAPSPSSLEAAGKKRQAIIGLLASSQDLSKLYKSPSVAVVSSSAEEVVAKALTGDTAAVMACRQTEVTRLEHCMVTLRDAMVAEDDVAMTSLATKHKAALASLAKITKKAAPSGTAGSPSDLITATASLQAAVEEVLLV